jgi:hypothetical protein
MPPGVLAQLGVASLPARRLRIGVDAITEA